MAETERRVVITGLGLLTPLGIGPDAFVAALREGRSGIGELREFPVDGLACRAAAEVPPFDIRALAHPKHRKAITKNLKYMARDIQLAVAAAELAMTDAGLADGGVDPTRIGLDLGAGLISSDLDELAPAINHSLREDGPFDFSVWGREGIPMITPIWLLKYLPNMLACHISIFSDCQGPSNSITEAESASTLAMGESLRILRRGRADVMVTGGADSKIHPLSLVRMVLLDQLTRWDGDPSRACRPFDRDRDGWVPGEGAGIVIFEEYGHAVRRGARIYGEVLGFGAGTDANPAGGIDPDGRGTEVAVRAALRDAGLQPRQVGHVNAQGSALVAMDRAEARAFNRVFGPRGVPVTGLKGYIGNTVSGSGAIEMVGSLLALNAGFVPRTRNCENPDPTLELDVVAELDQPAANPIFVKTTVTRHGQAAALVVRAYPHGLAPDAA
jgi:3-oxoacyl-[acyl-carrier-protein] synthase II